MEKGKVSISKSIEIEHKEPTRSEGIDNVATIGEERAKVSKNKSEKERNQRKRQGSRPQFTAPPSFGLAIKNKEGGE
jgi:hypothetical protein